MTERILFWKALVAVSFAAPFAPSPATAQSWVDPPSAEQPSASQSNASNQASIAPSQPTSESPYRPVPNATEPISPKIDAARSAGEPSHEVPSRQTTPQSEPASNGVAAPPNPPSRSAAPAKPELKPAPPQRAARSDPPPPPAARSVRHPRRVPTPEAGLAARPQSRERATVSMSGAARQLAIDYLGYWSSPNAVAVGSTPDFYGPRVLFHGRSISARALADEKRRFVQRWPQRYYTPRLDTMRTSCDPARDVC